MSTLLVFLAVTRISFANEDNDLVAFACEDGTLVCRCIKSLDGRV